MKLQDLQQWVQDSWKNRPVSDRPTDEQKLLFVIEEFGEVAEAIRKIKGKKDVEVDLGSEFADLLVSLITLANAYGIDLTAEIELFKEKIIARQKKEYS